MASGGFELGNDTTRLRFQKSSVHCCNYRALKLAHDSTWRMETRRVIGRLWPQPGGKDSGQAGIGGDRCAGSQGGGKAGAWSTAGNVSREALCGRSSTPL